MPYVTSPDGTRLKYSLEGDGPPVLLHLGAGCDSELWRAAGYVEPLSKTYQCILFDHRGHGQSDHPRGAEAYHIDRYAADVIAVMDELHIASTAFWGYSAGIDVGLKVADAHPERIWALVGSGGMGRTSPEELTEMVARRVAELREHGWEKMLERFDGQEREPVAEWAKDRIRATDIQQFIDYLEGAPRWGWEDWDALPRISTPTLFMTGELEDPDDKTAEAAARMPNGTRRRVLGRGHINAFLGSEEILPTVREFLDKHAPS